MKARPRSRLRRPFAVAAVAGTAAHHGFELASGVGLVWQPELGLARAGAVWMVELIGWAALAARGGQRADGALAVLAGASLAGVGVHFVLWPWKRGPLGLPLLTEAEGLSPRQLPVYNMILWGWATASAGSLAFEIPRASRPWALAGAASLPAFVVSARHHFEWVNEQAETNPSWWNRGIGLASPHGPRAEGKHPRHDAEEAWNRRLGVAVDRDMRVVADPEPHFPGRVT
jgi:hypothetical protein